MFCTDERRVVGNDIFPPDWGGCSEGLDAFRCFFKPKSINQQVLLNDYCTTTV